MKLRLRWLFACSLVASNLVLAAAWPAAAGATDVYEPDDTFETAKPIPVDGSMQYRSYETSGDDFFAVPVREGRAYEIRLYDSVLSVFRVSIFDPDRTPALTDQVPSTVPFTYWSAPILYIAPADGVAYLKVHMLPGTSTLYGAAVTEYPDDYEPDGSFEQAKPVTTDGVAQQRGSQPGGDDFFAFHTSPGLNYSLRLSAGDLDSYAISVYDPDHTTATVDQHPAGGVLYAASQEGTAYAKVHMTGGPGVYDFSVTESPWQVSGRVTDYITHAPLPGILVALVHESGEEELQFTGADGRYVFWGVSTEPYVTVHFGDYSGTYAAEWWNGHIPTLDEEGFPVEYRDELPVSLGATSVADAELYPDSEGPVVTVVAPGNSSWVRSYPTVALSAVDQTAGVDVIRCSIDGGTAFSYSAPVSIAREGYHTLSYWALDRVGNPSGPFDIDYMIDTQAPQTALVGGTAYYYASAVDVRLSPSDAVSGVRYTFYRLDGGIQRTGTSIHLTEGSHTLVYWSRDEAGNNEAQQTVSILVSSGGPPPPPPPAPALTALPGHALYTPVTPSTVYYGRSFSMYGYLKPRHTAGAVSAKLEGYRYERQSDGTYKWVRRATWYPKNYNYSTYTKYLRSGAVIKLRGKWKVRAVHTHTGYLPKYSAWRYFTVR